MPRKDKRPAYSSTARVSTANPVASCVTTVGFVTPTAGQVGLGRPNLAQEEGSHRAIVTIVTVQCTLLYTRGMTPVSNNSQRFTTQKTHLRMDLHSDFRAF